MNSSRFTRHASRFTVHASRLVVLALSAVASAEAQTRLVIVSGLGGAPKYAQSFAVMSSALAQSASERAGLPDSVIHWYGESNSVKSKWFRGPSLKDTVEAVLTRLAARPATEQLVIVLIGHGSGEGADTKVSLPGPDLTARDFSRLLGKMGTRRVALLNLTSASGDMMEVLAAPGRVVITATKSAFERNESHFGEFFVGAFVQDGADTDKDNRVSLLEAFKFAEAETKRLYDADGRMATEHPQIADASEVARQFFLTPGARAIAGGNERLTALYAERSAIDDQIQVLKKKKTTMTADAYDAELERLLVALATKAREIRQLEGK
jgi:hypothetical protein